MHYNDLLAGMHRFGSSRADICRHGLGVSAEEICENAVIAPWWEPAAFPGFQAAFISESDTLAVKVWHVTYEGVTFSYIKTGIGAPVLTDALFSLGVTGCKRILFAGSVGALAPDMAIGDIVLPQYSLCGDGASRYFSGPLAKSDVFGQKAYPDATLFAKAEQTARRICQEQEVAFHMGQAFSTDSIFTQFHHLDEILALGCNCIEMETAAAFRAAQVMGIPLAALFSVSDNTLTKQSLVSGRTQTDRQRRHHTRAQVFPLFIKEMFTP